jgi:hypothetical protein
MNPWKVYVLLRCWRLLGFFCFLLALKTLTTAEFSTPRRQLEVGRFPPFLAADDLEPFVSPRFRLHSAPLDNKQALYR